MTTREMLRRTKEILSTSDWLRERGSVESEAETIVLSLLEKDRAELFMNPDEAWSEPQKAQALAFAERRAQGEALQYILGFQTFLNHDYLVGPGVLIPRPETEILVTTLQTEIHRMIATRDSSALRGLEIGLGSGVISIELLSTFPRLEMVATELSALARDYGQRNAERILGTERNRLEILAVDAPESVFEPVKSRRFDFIVSNPPYLAGASEADVDVVQNEPGEALFVEDPLYFYRALASEAAGYLSFDGFVAIEVPSNRARSIGQLFENQGWTVGLSLDLSRRVRVLVAHPKRDSSNG